MVAQVSATQAACFASCKKEECSSQLLQHTASAAMAFTCYAWLEGLTLHMQRHAAQPLSSLLTYLLHVTTPPLPPLQVLSCHVIPSAAVLSSQLSDGQTVTTALADSAPLTVSLTNGSVTFVGPANNATVKVADIRAGASVIHVIDDVLLPQADESAPDVTAAQGAPAPAPAPAAPAAPARSSAAAAATGALTVLLGAAVALMA
jgi:hypothetical protein